jgi:hypothetical protein
MISPTGIKILYAMKRLDIDEGIPGSNVKECKPSRYANSRDEAC